MAELLWECIIISIVILFGINIGLAMGFTKFPRGKVLSISVLYGAILFALSMLANYATPVYGVSNYYIPYIMGIVGIVTIISGIITTVNWKKDKSEYYSFKSLSIMVPSICCFVGFIFAAILLNNKNTEVNFLLISIIMTILLVVLIVIFNLFSRFLRYAERPFPVLLGNYMILNGFYFIIAGLFIPNIKLLATIQMNPLTIGSTTNMIFLLMAAAGVLLVGVYLTREGKTV